MPVQKTAVKDDAVFIREADRTEIARLERIDALRVGLGHIARSLDLFIQQDHHAVLARLRIGRHADRVVEIERAIAADRGKRPHRPDNHYRLVGVNDEIQEVGRLFHRRRAVRDDGPRGIGTRQPGVDLLGQLQQNLGIDAAASRLRYLFVAEISDLGGFGNIRQQLVRRNGPRPVGVLQVTIGGISGDRATRGEDPDPRQSLRVRGCCRTRHQQDHPQDIQTLSGRSPDEWGQHVFSFESKHRGLCGFHSGGGDIPAAQTSQQT